MARWATSRGSTPGIISNRGRRCRTARSSRCKFAARNIITDHDAGVPYPPCAIYGLHAPSIPFPTETNAEIQQWPLPYIAFNYLGQLTHDGQNPAGQDEYIPLARGSVLPAMDPSTKALQFSPADVSETPPGNSTSSAYNIVDIDPLTGRATLRFQKVQ
jgi:hypothetical protein